MAEPLNLETMNALLAACGCCEMPRCCPPVIQCRSGFGRASSVGFINDGASDDRSEPDLVGVAWKQTRWLRHRNRTQWLPLADEMSTLYWTGSAWVDRPAFPYVSLSCTGAFTRDAIQEFSQAFDASVSGAPNTEACEISEAVFSNRCEASGTLTVNEYMGYYNPFTDTWTTGGPTRTTVMTLSEVSGTETDSHIQWELDAADWDLAHPDYATELAAWQILHDAYEAWLSDREEWVALDPDNNFYEDYPVAEPTDPGEAPPPRPDEPPLNYPPCSFRTDFSASTFELVWDGSTPSFPLVTPLPGESNPNLYHLEGINTEHVSELPVVGIFENPVTYEAWQAAVEAWFATRRVFPADSSSGCEPGNLCAASRYYSALVDVPEQSYVEDDWFSYRIKLNKCCGYKKILSGWREVFFPLAYLDWLNALALLGSSDIPPPAPVDLNDTAILKQWLWEGVPPLCPDDSGSDSSTLPPDPFDHEPMWSPWSLLVKVPGTDEGLIALRNYWQKCYGNLPDEMPAAMGYVDLPESI